jgi:hypothetical protein
MKCKECNVEMEVKKEKSRFATTTDIGSPSGDYNIYYECPKCKRKHL